MRDVTIRKRFTTCSGADLKRYYAEERAYKADRKFGTIARLKYLAHAEGWVMAWPCSGRPIVLDETTWRGLPPCDLSPEPTS